MYRWLRTWGALAVIGVLSAALQGPSFAGTARTISLSIPSSTTTAAAITFSGTLTHSAKGSLIAIRRRSGSSWVVVGYTKTLNAAGSYTHAIKAPTTRGTYYFDTFAARTQTANSAVSPSRAVAVRTLVHVSLVASNRTPIDGRNVQLTGGVAPWVPGTPVVLQRSVGGATTWSNLVALSPNVSGHFARTVAPAPDIETRYRVVVIARGYYTSATSAIVSVLPQPVGLSWGPSSRPVPVTGFSNFVQCPSSSFCMLIGAESYQTWSGGSWSVTQSLPRPMSSNFGTPAPASCSVDGYCMLIDPSVNGTAYYSVFDGQTWATPVAFSPSDPIYLINSVACASATFCITTESDGSSLVWNGTSWTQTSNFGSQAQVTSYGDLVLCASPTSCWTQGGARWDGNAWTNVESVNTSSSSDRISCASATFCVDVDNTGTMRKYDGQNWLTVTSPWPTDEQTANPDVSCPSADFCVSVAGEAANPKATMVSTFDGTTWSTPALLHSQVGNTSQHVACPTTKTCFEVDGINLDGDTQMATYQHGTWGAPAPITQANYLSSLSCLPAGPCYTADLAGNLRTFDGSTWSSPTTVDPASGVTGISCATTTFCAVVDDRGGAVMETDGSWGSRQAVTEIDPGTGQLAPLESISCTADGACMASSNNGNAYQYENGVWAKVNVTSQTYSFGGSVACGSMNYCVSTGGYWWNGATWLRMPDHSGVTSNTAAGGPSAVTCFSASDCLVGFQAWQGFVPDAVHLVDGAWSGPTEVLGGPISQYGGGGASAMSCITATRCAAFSNDGLVTFTATGFASAGPLTFEPLPLTGLAAPEMSCVHGAFCVALADGFITVGH